MSRLLLLLGCLVLASPLAAQPGTGSVLDQFRLAVEGVTFIENQGQWPDEVAFLARLHGVDVWVTSTSLVYDFYERGAVPTSLSAMSPEGRWGRVVEVRFVGGRAARVEGGRPQPGYHNYLFGNDASQWATRVPLYGDIVLQDIYDGVSLRLYEDGGFLQQELMLGPTAEPSAVRIEIEGGDGLDLSSAGVLDRSTILGVVELPSGAFSPSGLSTPAGFGAQGGGMRLRYARFLGGTDEETVRAVALDASSAVYVGGQTKSADFPAPNGYDQEREGGREDAYLAQVDASGNQVYGTYIGGDRAEEVRGVAYANESVYLTGMTESPDFPTTPGAYEEEGSGNMEQDAFVMRLRTDGTGPVFATYLGGSGDGAGEDDAGAAIAVTPGGAVVVAGRTEAEDFPAPNGEYDDRGDAFVVVLSSDGTAIEGGTFMGGGELDEIRALKLGNGTIYVAGDTRSGDFEGLEGGFGGDVDAFVARLSESGNTLLGGTYIGGSGLEGATGNGGNDRTGAISMTLGADGNVYVAGDTSSDDFPATFSIGPLGQADAFVTRLAVDATGIVGSAVIGGSGIDRARGIAIGLDGTIQLVGETSSADFPVQRADDATYNQLGDAFIIQLTQGGGEVVYGTYLGGSNEDAAFDVAVGEDGLTYVVGETQSGTDFPVSPVSPLYQGSGDAFVASYDLRPNAPPVVAGPLADVTLSVATPSFTADLAEVFDDPDGDALTYACSSDAPSVAAVTDCADGMLTVTAVDPGEATITVTATDPVGGSATDTFVVTVENLPPVVAVPPEDAVLALDDDPLVLDLAPVFDDPEGDALAYTCSSSAPSVASVSGCASGMLTVTPIGVGTATITLIASDAANPSVSTDFMVTVVLGNAPPTVVAPIPNAALALGDDPLVVGLDTVFDDPDGDALTYACQSSAPGVAAVSECSSGTLTVTAVGVGTATVTVTASDPDGASGADAFVVTVPNPPPVVSAPIPDAMLALGSAPLVIALASVFTDPNGDTLTYTCQSSAPGVAAVSGCLSGTLTVTPLAVGSATVTVTASDGSANASDIFAVTVTNPPPVVVSPIADRPLLLGGDPFSVDLDTVFADPNGDALAYSFAVNTGAVQLSLDGSVLVVTASALGAATVTVTASDGSGSASEAFAVTVTDNLPPVVLDPPEDATLVVGEGPLVVPLAGVFTDPEGDALALSCGTSAPSVASVGGCGGGTLTVTAVGAGVATVTITASDGFNPDVSVSFVVTVLPDNFPPTVVAPIPDAALALGDGPLVIALAPVFDDPDGDALTYACSSSAPGVVAVSGCPSGTLMVAVVAAGTATVTVTASDGSASASDIFAVTVTNPPPVVVSPIADRPLLLGGDPFSVDLDTVFADPNGDALAYSFAVNTGAVQLSLDGSVLVVTASALGVATVTVTASDGSGSASEAFAVTVTDNLPPVVLDPPEDITLVLEEAPLVITLAEVFVDPEGEALTFACRSSAPSVASVSGCADGILTVTPETTGVTTITITASDGSNSTDVMFVVTVVLDNPPPIVESPIPDAALALGDDALVVGLDTVFADPNGGALTYLCQSSAPAVASVSGCADGTLTVTPEAEGAATVTVTASDPDGASVSDAFAVTVTNPPPVVVSPIADRPLLLGGDPFSVDLDTVFADPNGDALAYSFAVNTGAVQLSLDGSVLVVTASALGAATVTVTASDGSGSASEAFAVTVTDNLPPVVLDPPEDATLVVGEGPLVVPLAGVFTDPEGDALALSCGTSAPSVASVGGCGGGTLTVTAVGAGVATVTITASDGRGSTDASFTVTVVLGNVPPTVVAPIPDAALALGDDPLVIALASVFDDPDGDALTYACSSSAPDVASVSGCSGGTLTVMSEAEGAATITVTASDPDGASVEDAFVVTIGSNAAPVVVNPLADVTFALGDAPLVVDLAGVFTDPNGDALAYACQSSAPGVASVSDCSDGTLTVTPEAEGAATVTVTASDPDGAGTPDSFTATVGCSAVSITEVTPSPVEPERGADVAISATAAGGQSATLRYRQGGAESYVAVTMVRSGDSFTATIPGVSVTERGVDYFVEAQSACGSTSQSAPFSLRVRVSAGVTSPELPASTALSGYRLVSVPLTLEEDGAPAVLDDFGSAGEGWLLLDLLPPEVIGDQRAAGTDDQWYRDDASAISMVPGSAYWLIARRGGRFTTGAGATVLRSEPFGVDLHRGWNLVGSPFGYDVPVDRVRMESGAPLQLQAYEGAWRNETAAMAPFQGYALYADAEDRLIVEPSVEVSPRPAARTAKAPQADRTGRAWAIDITAEIGEARDDNNTALVMPGATNGRDAADWVEPPLVGAYVSVAFAASTHGALPLTIDARPISEDGVAWPVRVRSNIEGRVALSFDGLDSVPADYVVWLVDEAAASVRDLRRNSSYTVSSQGNGAAMEMRLVVGTPVYARATSGFDGATPSDYALDPSYPNPFRSVSTIQFALPSAEHVILEVFDIVGRRVATLVDGEVDAGYHRVVWDGRGTAGHTDLASGVYIYRLRAGTFTATQRAVLVR